MILAGKLRDVLNVSSKFLNGRLENLWNLVNMSQFLGDIRYTPEINMETKNEGLEDDFPFQSIQGLVFMFFCGAFGK